MARKKNKTYTLLTAEDVKAIDRKASGAAHHAMMQNTSVRGGAHGNKKYSRKQKHKEVYA